MTIAMPPTPDARLLEQWHQECDSRASEIDPRDEQDWFSLALGWAIAKDQTIDNAHNFALYVRYLLKDR